QADPRIQSIYDTYYSKKEKDFIELLLFIGESNISTVQKAIDLLNKINPLDITTEKIKFICNRDYDNFVENKVPHINSSNETESKNLLDSYKFLIPISTEGFNNEVTII
ncbi:hypothetical protein LGK97_19680, partial [Clostridium sp. CS001]|nr:hypothetical protein [Clostridium sp. CS001]